jgi:hypothetical protein
VKPFRRAVIHIGTERTGSTSVQKAIFAQRRLLAEAGVFAPLSLLRSYERDARVANHVLLVLAVADEERFPFDLVPEDMPEAAASPALVRRQILEALAGEVKRDARGAHTLLVSAEHIHSRLDTSDSISRLRDALAPLADDFLIFAVLRPQVEMAVSLANLVLRRGGAECQLIPRFDEEGGYDRALGVRRSYFELDDMVRRFEAVFGTAAIRPCRYNSGADFDSRTALFGTLGIEVPVPDDRENASLSPDALQVMRSIQRHIDVIRVPAWRNGFIDDVERILVREHRGPGLRPGRAAALAFMEGFAAGNESLRQRYFPNEESLFDVDYERYPAESETLGEIPGWTRVLVDVAARTWRR